MPAKAFLSSEADGDGEPEFSVPHSPRPAEAAVSVPALAGVVGSGLGGEVLNGGAGGVGGVGTGAGGSARKQVSQDREKRRFGHGRTTPWLTVCCCGV